jgi:hypothetical protein
MTSSRRFSTRVLTVLAESRIVGIRAGSEPHRFIGIWMVIVEGRVFVRSWNDKPEGWRRAFLADSQGVIQLPGRQIRVRARTARGTRLMKAIDLAYGEKYKTPASRKFVRGFARPRRRMTTMELLPR